MYKVCFDQEKYTKLQSERIRERIAQFGGKLYLEFGGKLFDDFHASRVLPGFAPDSKVRMLTEMKEDAEIVIVINAGDIEKNKVRGDLSITYDQDVLRLIDAFREIGLYVGSVVLTRFADQPSAVAFQKRLESLGIRVYRHYSIPGYPANLPLIVSDEGYGKNDYIETTRRLVVVTAPGPGSGKMATCLSNMYHDHKRGVRSGYAKFETFPIWNLPLSHPVNLAYEAATADLNDVNMIDPYHLEAYGVTTVNYNRDVEIFPVVSAMLRLVSGECPYQSPTDMGVNMAGYCITDDAGTQQAAKDEIIRRYYKALCDMRKGIADGSEATKIEIMMNKAGITTADRPVIAAAQKKAEETVKKAEETAKKAETTVKAAAKTTAKKATKKVAAKKTAKAEKKELVPEVFVQFNGNEDVVANVIERAKEAFAADGHRASSIKSLKVYLKPEEYAAYYVVYGNRCDAKRSKYYQVRLETTNNNSFTVTHINGSRLVPGNGYKFKVVAYDEDGNIVEQSQTLHIVTKGGKSKNYTGLKIKSPKKGKAVMTRGKTLKIKAKAKGKRVKKHSGLLYQSSNPSVARVTNKGKIVGVNSGSCVIYVCTQNGIYKTVRVTVK